MNGLQVVQYRYAENWPIWCVVKGGRVLLCSQTEAEGGKTMTIELPELDIDLTALDCDIDLTTLPELDLSGLPDIDLTALDLDINLDELAELLEIDMPKPRVKK